MFAVAFTAKGGALACQICDVVRAERPIFNPRAGFAIFQVFDFIT